MSTVKFCVDRLLPVALEERAKALAEGLNPNNLPDDPTAFDRPEALALDVRKLWAPGSTLRVRFLDGDPAIQAKVAAIAPEWGKHANIRFAFGNDPDAEIRISFLQSGSWSYIGIDALLIDKSQPTMNYGWFALDTPDEEYRRVVLHEFGHALGCVHEHQNPGQGGIPWNEPVVLAAYAGAPNFWSEAQVRENILKKYDAEHTQFTVFDKYSIMLYPVPEEHTLGDFAVPWSNSELSDLDKAFIGEMYPF